MIDNLKTASPPVLTIPELRIAVKTARRALWALSGELELEWVGARAAAKAMPIEHRRAFLERLAADLVPFLKLADDMRAARAALDAKRAAARAALAAATEREHAG